MSENNAEIQAIRNELLFSQKRYEIALRHLSDIIFDYVISTKQIIHYPGAASRYGLPDVIDHGPEAIIQAGIVHPKSIERFRSLFGKMDEGAQSAVEIVIMLAQDGEEIINEITLTSILDEKHSAVRAIGVAKNITQALRLQREEAYRGTLLSDRVLCYEANVTTDKLTHYDRCWLQDLHLTGVVSINSMTEMLESLANAVIAPEHRQLFLRDSSRKTILEAFEEGRRQLAFEYLKKTDQDYEWFQKTIHIIRDALTGDINIRSYIKNIHPQKIKELRALEEQRFYETMTTKSDAVYETNLARDIVVSGQEGFSALLGVKQLGSYSRLIAELSEKAVHPDDRGTFHRLFLRDQVLRAFMQGQNQLEGEYRRLNEQGEFVWIRTITHLVEDPVSGEIKGYTFDKNIDAEKKEQLALLYRSQHDGLTGMYNKLTVEDRITAFLATSAAKAGTHAFLILDIDYFKPINDTFGHAFGDAFLSQTASKIRALFRDDDILGRIGGDEFVVFMKNVQSEKAVTIKVTELCTLLFGTHMHNGIEYPVSASIGVALYGRDGKSYDQLYRNSDTALYYAKEHGRNRFAIYSEEMLLGKTAVNAIDSGRLLLAKTFEEDISAYVFRILYETTDKQVAINTVLELICKHYNVSRAYIFENSADALSTQNTFKWCEKGDAWQPEYLRPLSGSRLLDYAANFNADGIFYRASTNETFQEMQSTASAQAFRSVLQFSIVKNGEFVGFIGFDQCDRLRVPTQNELSECRNIANVLGLFITEMRAIEASTEARRMAMSVVNGLGSYAYVCDAKTREILFINEPLTQLIPAARTGDLCHKAFRENNEVCADCPLETLLQSGERKITKEMFHTSLDIWVQATSSWIDWIDGKKACLVDSVDISKYMPKPIEKSKKWIDSDMVKKQGGSQCSQG